MRKIFNSKSPPKVHACTDSRCNFCTANLKTAVYIKTHPLFPQTHTLISSNRLIEPFKDGMKESNKKMKRILSDSSVGNPHIPNIINITQRYIIREGVG